MITRKGSWLFLLFFLSVLTPRVYLLTTTEAEAADEAKNKEISAPSLQQKQVISVWGRLTLETHGQDKWLILQAKNTEAYFIKGGLVEKLKQLLLDLGRENLVFLTGNKEDRGRLSCEKQYHRDDLGRLKDISAKCIRYNELEVTSILKAKKSSEYIPPPKRDTQEERKLIAGIREEGLPPVFGEIKGVVTAVNLKSPIKTVEIENLNKDSPLKKITLIVSAASTRVAKKIGKEEAIGLGVEGLKAGQEIMASYVRDEFKTEALLITIIKEE